MDLQKVTRRLKAMLYLTTVAFGFTVVAAHEIEKYESRSEWITINLPDPPRPLLYTRATSSTKPRVRAQ